MNIMNTSWRFIQKSSKTTSPTDPNSDPITTSKLKQIVKGDEFEFVRKNTKNIKLGHIWCLQQNKSPELIQTKEM